MRKFNIRVYGILINSKNEVLVSDEERNGFQFTKFPGGGLEFGEGIHECLIREFKEELNLEIQVGNLFYLTDYFQLSSFNKNDQLISIYYFVSSTTNSLIKTSTEKLFQEGKENHRWIKISELKSGELTFPIDKLVCEKLK